MLLKLSSRPVFHHYVARIRFILIVAICAFVAASVPSYGQQALQLNVNWNKTTVVSKSTPTLQVVVNPPLRHGQPVSLASYKALKNLGADYVRYVPWWPYPKLVVPELQPPTPQKTSWDFSLIDPMTLDFLAATKGHPTVMNFSTIPEWMFKTDAPVTYPDAPNQKCGFYEPGTELRDPTGKELGDYYERLVSWYVDGGFTDENGVWHQSGYHYKLPVWEVLNEVEFEHNTTPQDYTLRYDAIVEGIHRASPSTKFMAMALGAPQKDQDFVKYFLNPANHKPGIPIDYISYHFYAVPALQETPNEWQYSFFKQADDFFNTVRSLEQIRQQLSPQTKTDLDELGVILPNDFSGSDDKTQPPFGYWNAAGSLYAYLYVQLSRMQIDIVGESQLVGFPTQYPSVSMMDMTNNKPNARYWVLKLIKDNFGPGDSLVDTEIGGQNADDLEAQSFLTHHGHKLLLINKRNKAIDVALPDAQKASAMTEDETSGDDGPRTVQITDGNIILEPFAVSVVRWK
jgi:hypothetical protein